MLPIFRMMSRTVTHHRNPRANAGSGEGTAIGDGARHYKEAQ
jgi:hypothetical protein